MQGSKEPRYAASPERPSDAGAPKALFAFCAIPGVENPRQEKASVFRTRERRRRLLHRVRRTLGGMPLSQVINCTDPERRCAV